MTTALVLMLIAVVFQLPSSTEGINCVRCGMGEEQPCGQTLPPLTQCAWEDKSCFVGVLVDRRTGRVHETRRCSAFESDGSSSFEAQGSLFGFLCPTDRCNYDDSERPPPPAPNCSSSSSPVTPTATSSSVTTVAGTTGPPPLLECIQCGWKFGEPCGHELPPARPCEAEHKSCFMGLIVDKNTSRVEEARGCDKAYFTSPRTGNLGDEFLIGVGCLPDGCNFDAERLRRCDDDVSNSSSPKGVFAVAALNVAALTFMSLLSAAAATSMGVASLV